jgi:hypothetical protein
MPGYERALRISKRVYEALLRAYPKEFREGYEPRMAQALEDMCWED